MIAMALHLGYSLRLQQQSIPRSGAALFDFLYEHSELAAGEELPENLVKPELDVLEAAAHIIRFAPVSIWRVPAALEEYLWVTGRNEQLKNLALALVSIDTQRELLVSAAATLEEWWKETFVFLSRLQPVLFRPVTRLIASYRMADAAVRSELFGRFGVEECQRIASYLRLLMKPGLMSTPQG
jgi:hypothetical protein